MESDCKWLRQLHLNTAYTNLRKYFAPLYIKCREQVHVKCFRIVDQCYSITMVVVFIIIGKLVKNSKGN
jgi:hypothetical protein